MRTLGIIAHIDAGKTTLTERILTLTQRGLEAPTHAAATYVAPGDVDSGSTVTDFLEEERERGITIQSAAVGPIWWRDMAMTLVDTPGHIDFGIEVERAVRVVDGTIVVLDGVEGVEPQSENVWRQAKRYGVDAHLFFVNKLDRPGACISRSVRSIIDAGLHERPVLLQLPAYAADVGESDASGDRPLVGVVDLLSLHLWRFRGVAGERMEAVPLEASMPVYERALLARQALIDTLGSLDDDLLEHIVMLDEGEAVDVSLVQAALRRLTLAGRVCPVLCGAAAVNIGVQPLLDAVHKYLPSPADRPLVRGVLEPDTPRAREVDVALSDSTPAALAFKVVWDRRRGPITFVKVYAGTLHAAQSVINTTGRHKERLARLLLPYATSTSMCARCMPAKLASCWACAIHAQATRSSAALPGARCGCAACMSRRPCSAQVLSRDPRRRRAPSKTRCRCSCARIRVCMSRRAPKPCSVAWASCISISRTTASRPSLGCSRPCH